MAYLIKCCSCFINLLIKLEGTFFIIKNIRRHWSLETINIGGVLVAEVITDLGILLMGEQGG
jgi:hypothetical protein